MKQDFMNYLVKVNPNYDMDLIEKAYNIAEEYHEGQLRKSGEPYLIHPVAVAKILADLGMDEDTIMAGLLHDVVEDTPYTNEDLRRDFGDDVELLVDGVTKLKSLKYESKEESQAENLRKMFLAMSKDIRVLIIKLADRLHNLRTINYMTEAKIREKCTETLEVYAPLASRLGIYTIKFEYEDIALKMLDPEAYYNIANAMNCKKEEREEAIKQVIKRIDDALKPTIQGYEIKGRSKHFYSIYRKMKYQNKQLDEIFDLTAVRVIVGSVKDCYAVLGMVHTMWKPVPKRFKDYIAMPKNNRYQSLHTTVFGDDGTPFEIQIRTWEMHQIAEYGIAAHWKYKEGKANKKADEEVKLSWLRQTLEWQKELNDSKEFLNTLKMDLFSNQVYVLTPKGDAIELPAGSTPLDFAFKIHSAVGAKCIGAKVNGKMVPIDYELQNGQIVDIVTSNSSKGPSIDWLKIVKTNTAKTKIRQWLKKENRSENTEKGKEMLEKLVRRKGYDQQQIMKSANVTKAAKTLNYGSAEELYTAISYGGVLCNKVLVMLVDYYHQEKQAELKQKEKEAEALEKKKKKVNHKNQNNSAGIKVEGVDNLLVRFSKCCNPVPGDEIVGFITKGRGLSIHRKDCINVLSLPEAERARFINVEWDLDKENLSYDADIHILAEDRKGLLSDISRLCENMDVNITGIHAQGAKDGIVNILLTVSISNISHVEKMLTSMKAIPGIADVYRAIS
ncbi:MAG: bifunctional (p)ppGpp synthetase/guanosine-3',5'-bis(diphosphate) 3'-pyrophosphohydrolase [Firmicutes bacterium]|nr:bifunctional (p)ppGpp synthetase/guanosine-3',5'-bis(diphosphate) 3'-pyrophosphohydrolase [Bacillota bacterium]MBR7148920.1 bifunctional (p)ppGpp synthetase/guanosine-3',5'-bis(diphosphate) 3'-pyrophosphohydrolase [Bacillota bacterium]